MPTFYAVGVGPGDPELVTRKAERILRQADVVLAPVSRPGESSVALETVRGFLDEQRQEIVIHQFPMTSDPEQLIPAWQAAAVRIAEQVAAGRDVAFITIGDPLLYSTFIYLLRIVREHYPQLPVEIVPGISSIMTAAAVAAVPLAEGDERLAIVPATAGVEAICEAMAKYETVVLLKVRPLFAEILELLRQTGRSGSTVFIERAGGKRQKVIRDISEMAAHSPDYLSLMIVRRP
ncbi:precorrin-2 C(20)-methyltransferase [Geobacter sp. SVR]|uniref:precorrin-2 C(20)-methyltransferase n=1 Tax=Geobacter sp. SVR TaxID=2495594 RepID=UPI00143EF70F|nr:precorrin-2 C(20)-methyltransferase [Geobacter sp. SVR]BCS55715.1 precorrin-2 C(20)-methyltransferase [Geobacter sp. SVR]GCF83719.1 precorrin-2 C(20)-methyltransferase [Geobacter sp. SVR]